MPDVGVLERKGVKSHAEGEGGAVPWIEWQIGSKITGLKLYDSVLEKNAGSHMRASAYRAVPSHLGSW
jgi:hypothetical protein